MTRVLYILSSFKKNIDYFRFYGSVKIVNGNISVKLKSHVIRFLKKCSSKCFNCSCVMTHTVRISEKVIVR